ncbi:MAG: hypothetical protein ACJ8AG_15725, partial [Ktedonobacteraceae bacterium]
CRQSFSRAKKHLSEHRPRFPASPETQRQMLTGFMQAVNAGEMTALMNLLAEDVTFWGDGGGKVKGAATHPFTRRGAVARFLLGPGTCSGARYQRALVLSWQKSIVNRRSSRVPVIEPLPC